MTVAVFAAPATGFFWHLSNFFQLLTTSNVGLSNNPSKDRTIAERLPRAPPRSHYVASFNKEGR